jgi:hypothetical protein
MGQLLSLVILQAILHEQRQQHIASILAYFDYMRVGDTIKFQKSEVDTTDTLT